MSSQEAAPKMRERTQELYCNYCRSKGHVLADCFKRKRKEEVRSSQSMSFNPIMSSASIKRDSPATVAGVFEQLPESSSSSTVAAVQKNSDKQIELTDSTLFVTNVNGSRCNLLALIDTGSPASFIRPSVFENFFQITIASQSDEKGKFQAAKIECQ